MLKWVSPFRNLRIKGYLLLPEAYRSLSRLSSALSAKASTLRSSSLDLVAIRSAPVQSLQAVTSLALRDCSSSAKMGFLRSMTVRFVLTVYHPPSHLCADNSWYIALYAVICFLKLNSFLSIKLSYFAFNLGCLDISEVSHLSMFHFF